MFLGDAAGFLYLLEIAFRTAVMYLYTPVFARFVGKRSAGHRPGARRVFHGGRPRQRDCPVSPSGLQDPG